MQLFLEMRTSTLQADLAELQSCTHAVKQWFTTNNLLSNPDKSEVTAFRSAAQQASPTAFLNSVIAAGANLPISVQLKSLGVLPDSRLTFKAQVAAVSKSCS
jgi:hypothetical protein